jgi:hypothetical protein
MIVHTAVQEPIDANRLNASLKATQETHRNMMILHCRQSWGESGMTIGHGPTPITADRMMKHGEGPAEQLDITPLEPKQHTPKTTTARQLKMDSTQKEKDNIFIVYANKIAIRYNSLIVTNRDMCP